MTAQTTPRRRTGFRAGFTLIELLVSVTLMTILTGSVVFVFVQAQKIFVQLDAKARRGAVKRLRSGPSTDD